MGLCGHMGEASMASVVRNSGVAAHLDFSSGLLQLKLSHRRTL